MLLESELLAVSSLRELIIGPEGGSWLNSGASSACIDRHSLVQHVYFFLGVSVIYELRVIIVVLAGLHEWFISCK